MAQAKTKSIYFQSNEVGLLFTKTQEDVASTPRKFEAVYERSTELPESLCN